jgi:hypothetical protein
VYKVVSSDTCRKGNRRRRDFSPILLLSLIFSLSFNKLILRGVCFLCEQNGFLTNTNVNPSIPSTKEVNDALFESLVLSYKKIL